VVRISKRKSKSESYEISDIQTHSHNDNGESSKKSSFIINETISPSLMLNQLEKQDPVESSEPITTSVKFIGDNTVS
jgi:hypothetical protein